MSWHVGPPREYITGIAIPEMRKWHEILVNEAASNADIRWRLDAYIEMVTDPVTIADTFIEEWLTGLWRVNTT